MGFTYFLNSHYENEINSKAEVEINDTLFQRRVSQKNI